MRSEVYVSRFLRAFFPVILVILLMAGAGLFAQERFGSIIGVVYDSSKAVLPAAEVAITNLETRRVTTITTTDNGRYLARDLEPGRYSISAQKTGFSKAEYPEVILLLGKTINLDFTLQVGQVKETIVVSGSLTMIDTNTTAVTHNVTADEFDYMPKTRSFQSVALTSPSVTSGDIEGGIQVNGASGAENQYTVDGISTSSLIDGSSRENASYEYLQEVQVKTSGIEAEYGGALGGVISAVTKSGGAKFHGEFHWYNSGSPFNASPNLRLETDVTDDRISDYIQDKKFADHVNEFGGSIGGPIVKDKLFFFTSFSPQIRRQESKVEFSDGPSTFKSKRTTYDLFNKLSWEPTKRIRTNFSWIYNSVKRTGLLPGYDGMTPNSNTNAASLYASYPTQGWYAPQNNYAATVDITLSNTALLSLKGGYFWDNYKDLGAPTTPRVRYQVDATNLPFEIPAAYQHGLYWANTTLTTVNYFDITSRGYFQADYSQSFRFMGTHFFKVGAGLQKTVNTVKQLYQGGGYDVRIYWNRDYNTVGNRGDWGYYRIITYGTGGSGGASIKNFYLQDQWRIHPRLTLNLGLRTEHEDIPSMRADVQKIAMSFSWKDKLAPRLGASLDVLGNGKWKLFGSWGRFFDWTKYEMVRGSFGGQIWKEYFHALDAGTDIFSLSLTNTPGRNLLTDPFIDYRIPSFGADAVDPNIKPMYQDTMVIGSEYQLNSATTIGVNYIRSRLKRTIEDIGFVRGESFGYALGNPGENLFVMETNHISQTPDFPMPKPERKYDALQLTFNRRFSTGWYLGANYTYSKLRGNYSGLSDTDEIAPAGWTGNQGVNQVARPGTNTALFYDSEAFLLDANGKYISGPLATDRPHVFKAYGAYSFKWGTTVSANYFAGSGTPLTTQLEDDFWDPIMINNRGDLGRTPTLTQTGLMVSHEFKIKEGKSVRFEFNMLNLFNQKTVRHIDPLINRSREASAEINLTNENLLNGFDWRKLFSETAWAQNPELSTDPNSLDPLKNYSVSETYHKADVWNPPFSGRFGLKFIF